MSIEEKAKLYALECHQQTNHLYDDYLPYEFHLRMVVATAKKFIHLIPHEAQNLVLAGCWTHDVIEDCRQTYNDVAKATTKDVAELAYALTNEKGKSRDERANHKYYRDMKTIPYAVFVKLCDRIANVKYAEMTGSRMLGIYQQEYDEFSSKLWTVQYQTMFEYLKNILTV